MVEHVAFIPIERSSMLERVVLHLVE